jgi:hypothetical protein
MARLALGLLTPFWLRTEAAAMTERPPISPDEMQRRRKHVETAIADSRIEGFPPPSGPEKAIYDAYIRGEIEADDLVEAYRAGRFTRPR